VTEHWPVVGGTGHRPQHVPPGTEAWARTQLSRIARHLRDVYGCRTAVSGMALGFDLWWADEALRAGLKLWAHVPFPEQADRWRSAERQEWARLRAEAAKVTTYAESYNVRALHARNDGMLRVSSAMLALWDPAKTSGGTYSCVEKIRQRRMPWIHLDPVARTVARQPETQETNQQEQETLPL
jgi:hypothetical protein